MRKRFLGICWNRVESGTQVVIESSLKLHIVITFLEIKSTTIISIAVVLLLQQPPSSIFTYLFAHSQILS